MEQIKFAVLGCGQRGNLMGQLLCKVPGAYISAVCDPYKDKAENLASKINDLVGYTPAVYTDSSEAMDLDIDAVMIATAWEYHVPFAIEAMRKGIITLMEVGGAYSLQDCYDLVNVYEETRTPFMFLENCCYNKSELLATALVRNGLFGELVHCEGAYAHDCRDEIANGERYRHYRLRNYLTRNCENYPTHELGPIAKILGINRGNRMMTLVSIASKARGLEEFIKSHDVDEGVKGKRFKQGDIVTTIITCAGGETITLRLDTTLPRHYSRNLNVRGTKGLYEQDTNMVFFDGDEEYFDTLKFYTKNINNAAAFEDKYLCDEWKQITQEQLDAGHGGMDAIMLADVVRRIQNDEELPIDVYDAASWMVITALSEASIAAGGAIEQIPDFTRGKWIQREILDVVKVPLIK